jgi:hypothetical protein
LTLLNKGCNDPIHYQIETVDGIPYNQTGQVTRLNTTCFGFMCLNSDQLNGDTCFDYKIRQCCPRDLNQDEVCNDDYEWTEWFNLDTPDGDGDMELLSVFNLGCMDESTSNQIMTVDGIDFEATGEIVHFNTTCFGFMCLNKEQPNNLTCSDYKLRQCCPIV